jgi:hypothetical protein
MSFSSRRRVNSGLFFKRLFEAVPGTAGGAVVVATFDHALGVEILAVCSKAPPTSLRRGWLSRRPRGRALITDHAGNAPSIRVPVR